MRRAAVVCLSALALIGGLSAAPASAAPVPGPPYTVLGLAVNLAGYSAAGAREATGGDVDVDTLTTTSVLVSGPDLALGLTPPTGRTFTVGDTFGIAAGANATNGTARAVMGEHVCLQVTSGSVTVREAVVDGATGLSAFAADVDLACGANRWVGYVRYQSSVGYTGVTLSKTGLAFETMQLGDYRDLPVTLTATGTDDLPYAIGAVTGGDGADDFSVVGDTCKDRSLPAGESCTVIVRARPLVAGSTQALVTIVHDGSTPYEVELSAAATDVAAGTYRAVTPTRVLDTRTGQGGRRGPLPTGGVLRLNMSPYLSSPASAVVLNLTVDRPQKPGYLTAYPSGQARPNVSSMNFPAGWQGANLVTVPLGVGNQIDIYNYLGTTSVLADMVGFYVAGTSARGTGGGYHPTLVERLLDTRTWGFGKLPPGYSVSIPVRYLGDQQNISALAVTVTAVRPTGTGYLTTWNNNPQSIPRTSTLNFGRTSGVISNSAIVPAAYYGGSSCPTCATIGVLNMSSTPIDLVVDINGFFDRGALPAVYRYQPLTSPTRIVDSRSGLGTTPFGANTTRTITAPTSVAGYDTVALDANITAVAPTVGTYVTVWPTFDDYPRPLASILNPNARQTIANHAIAEVGFGNKFNLYNAAGTNNLLVDVSGTFEYFPHTPADQIPHQGGGPETVQRAAAATAGKNTAGVQPTMHAG